MNPLYFLGGAALLVMAMNQLNGYKNAVEGLKVFVTHPSKLKVSGGMITMDVVVNIDNNSPKSLPVESLQVSAYSLSGNAWGEFASSAPTLANLVIKPFSTNQIVVPMRTSIVNVGKELFSLLTNGGNGSFKFKVTPTFLGFRVPPVESPVFPFNGGRFLGEN